MKADPFPKDNCGKKECDMRDCGEKCYQGNVNYDLVCKMCESEGREKHVYMGESSRGCFSRGKQHREAYKSESGFMWEHDVREHGGRKNVEFEMKLIARDKDPMRRIIRESVRIMNGRKNGVKLMNRKDEWFGIKTVQVNFELD